METVKKERKKQENPSESYTLRSFKGVIQKLEKTKMATVPELGELKKIHKTIVERWIGGNLQL